MINQLDDSTIFTILHRAIKNNRSCITVKDVCIVCNIPPAYDYYGQQQRKERALLFIGEMEERGLITHVIRPDGTHAWKITPRGVAFYKWMYKRKYQQVGTI